jgi:hypothetical protein
MTVSCAAAYRTSSSTTRWSQPANAGSLAGAKLPVSASHDEAPRPRARSRRALAPPPGEEVVGNVAIADEGAFGCDNDVAGQRQLETAGHGMAVDCGDEDDRRGLHGDGEVPDALKEPPWRLRKSGVMPAQEVQVCPGAEAGSAAVNDDDLHAL